MIDFGGLDGLLIVGDSARNSDLYYATRFRAPDSFAFLCTPAERTILIGDLELDRARAQAQVDDVASLSDFAELSEDSSNGSGSRQQRALLFLLGDKGVGSVVVPANFPLETADFLRRGGINVQARPDPLFPQRAVKDADELKAVRQAMAATESALEEAFLALRHAHVAVDGTLKSEGVVLTSERLRQIVHGRLVDEGFGARNTIVACGEQGCDPHCEGSGPLRAHEPIIIDIFPQSDASGYFGDLTRTVVVGEPSAELCSLYDAVRGAQELAISSIRDGADGGEIHRQVEDHFREKGYETGERDGRMQGFFHGTGHGLGLDIHEAPSIGARRDILRSGQVVTVEPGLYYAGIGGVRIEDVVVVTDNGCRNLTSAPKQLRL